MSSPSARAPDVCRLAAGFGAIATRAHPAADPGVPSAGRWARRADAGGLGVGNALRYAATTGTVAIRWDGARAPRVWTVVADEVAPAEACRELAPRHLHILGPTTADRFARWAGISRRSGAKAFASLEGSLVRVRSPLGDEWLLADDEPTMRAPETAPAPARLLPSGDAYFLLEGAERELLVPAADLRQRLWTARVWPGALPVDGEIRGTWRRSGHTVRLDAWARLSTGTRDAIEAGAGASRSRPEYRCRLGGVRANGRPPGGR